MNSIYKKTRIGVVAVLVIALFLTLIPVDSTYALTRVQTEDTRIGGETRYDTAYMIADQLYKDNGAFSAIVVACGNNFPDALSGSYLAKLKNAPILLVDDSDTRQEDVVRYAKTHLKSNGKVYILGEEKAINKNIDKKLINANIEFSRLGGETRYDTNLMILEEAGGSFDEIMLCTGNDFADSISVSATGKPIMLVGDVLQSSQIEFLKTIKPKKIYVIGGTLAVSSEVYMAASRIASTERVGGNTRYDTSVLVARRFFTAFRPTSVIFTTALNFPDGLAGAPLAMKLEAPLIVVSDRALPSAASEYIQLNNITKSVTLGGTVAISDRTINMAMERYIDDDGSDISIGNKGTARDVINVMRSWLGYNEINGKFREIIDLYNSVYPLPVGYKMSYNDEWCDACVSAAAVRAGCSDLIGRECGVGRHVSIFQQKGIWIEDGASIPQPGDLIVFNWSQFKQPNNWGADHIGYVEAVANGTIITIEGNMKESVGRRYIPVGWGYIRGFARPNYRTAEDVETDPQENAD